MRVGCMRLNISYKLDQCVVVWRWWKWLQQTSGFHWFHRCKACVGINTSEYTTPLVQQTVREEDHLIARQNMQCMSWPVDVVWYTQAAPFYKPIAGFYSIWEQSETRTGRIPWLGTFMISTIKTLAILHNTSLMQCQDSWGVATRRDHWDSQSWF